MAEQSEVSVNPWVQQLKEFENSSTQHGQGGMQVQMGTFRPETMYTRQAPSLQLNPWLWPLVTLGQVSCAET